MGLSASRQGRRRAAGIPGREGLLHALAVIAILTAVLLPAMHRHVDQRDSRPAASAVDAAHSSSAAASTSADCGHDGRDPVRGPQPDDRDCPICHWLHQTTRGLAIAPPATGAPLAAPVTAIIAAEREHPLLVHRRTPGPARAPPC
ncbi:MAG: DUF2946 family protein [Phycisphaerales bacterium]|nr:DUF2946 family protein [Phycisphaerales bacterium]